MTTKMKIKPANGTVNVGGGFETPTFTNLNPIKTGSGGPTRDIPNHVHGGMEDMGDLFVDGSVKTIISSRLRYIDVNWQAATRAAFRAMAPGGQVEMNVWTSNDAQQTALVDAFVSAGFNDVRTILDGPGTMLFATKP